MSELKQPAAWSPSGVRAAFHVVVGTAGALLVAVAAVASARRPGERVFWLALAAGGALAALNLVEYGPWFGRGAEPVSRDGGLELPFSPLRARAGVLRDVLGILLGVVAFVVFDGGVAWVLGVMLVLLGASGLRAGRCRLVLAPETVTFTEGRRTSVLRWADVQEVAAGADPIWRHGAKQWYVVIHAAPRAVARTGPRGRPKAVASVRVPADAFAVDPVVAYWTLRYYADHPEARPELADARAVERVARRDLQAPPG